MFSLGGTEILFIAIFAVLVFGPDKIPQMARGLGKLLREFRKYKDMMEAAVHTEVFKAENPLTMDELEKLTGLDAITRNAQSSWETISGKITPQMPTAADVASLQPVAAPKPPAPAPQPNAPVPADAKPAVPTEKEAGA